ncbi:alpha/beta hydrolase [Paracoccus sp. (in: a-proteobacteria)]|uniref:alpha/beta hydrolase n=1 Tax=Paracoccus sp. TaxID=267 RepID=UPI002AFEEAAC|nr:alpha/beta hydrolase [Paracoccus sp. (in: a-proteobacteria)]
MKAKLLSLALSSLMLTGVGVAHAQQSGTGGSHQVAASVQQAPITVMKAPVHFLSNNIRISGVLFRPDTGTNLPAIVIGHPAGGVKEQTASLYAERLARLGYATLVFDAAYQGESGGEPRSLEDPFQRAEDVRAAVTYLSTRSDIDSKRIGALGICASGSYVPFAAQTDRRIKAVATVSAIDLIGSIFETPEVRDAMLNQAGEARNSEARGEGLFQMNHTPSTLTDAEALPPRSLFREAYDYYRTPRGAHPLSTQWGIMRMDVAAQFDAFGHNDWISPRPLLMIAGTDADTRRFSEEGIKKAKGPKELFLIKGASHVDLYDRDPYVAQAIVKLGDFFGKNLAN